MLHKKQRGALFWLGSDNQGRRSPNTYIFLKMYTYAVGVGGWARWVTGVTMCRGGDWRLKLIAKQFWWIACLESSSQNLPTGRYLSIRFWGPKVKRVRRKSGQLHKEDHGTNIIATNFVSKQYNFPLLTKKSCLCFIQESCFPKCLVLKK